MIVHNVLLKIAKIALMMYAMNVLMDIIMIQLTLLHANYVNRHVNGVAAKQIAQSVLLIMFYQKSNNSLSLFK